MLSITGEVWNWTHYGCPWCENALCACDAWTLQETQIDVSALPENKSFSHLDVCSNLVFVLEMIQKYTCCLQCSISDSLQDAEADQAVSGPPLCRPDGVICSGDRWRRGPRWSSRQVLLQPRWRDAMTPFKKSSLNLLCPYFPSCKLLCPSNLGQGPRAFPQDVIWRGQSSWPQHKPSPPVLHGARRSKAWSQFF